MAFFLNLILALKLHTQRWRQNTCSHLISQLLIGLLGAASVVFITSCLSLLPGWLQTPQVRTTKAPTPRSVQLKMELPLQSMSGLGCCWWVKVAAMATAAASIKRDKVTRGHSPLIPVSTQRESYNSNNKTRLLRRKSSCATFEWSSVRFAPSPEMKCDSPTFIP